MSGADDAFERAAEKQAMVDAMGEQHRRRRRRSGTGPGGAPPPFGPWAPGPWPFGPGPNAGRRSHNSAATWLVFWVTLLPVHWLVSPEVDGWFIAHLLLISFTATSAFSAWQRGKVWRVGRH